MSDPVVLYIGGCGRSGSTLLDRILGQVPGYASVGELYLLFRRGVLDDDLCGCGQPFSTCEFWTEVISRTFGPSPAEALEHGARLQQQVDRNRHLPHLVVPRLGTDATRRAEQEYADILARLYRSIAEVSGAEVVVDSSKHVATAWLLHRRRFDVRLLHLIRDARGMAYSWTKAVAKPESATGELMDQFPPPRSAARWVGYNLAFELLARAGVPATRLFYEDLARDPGAELARVVDRLDLPLSPGFDFLAGSAPELAFTHTVAGNPVRFREGPMRIQIDDEWRRAMPKGQQRVVTGLTAPLLAGYGYLSGRRG